MYKLGILVILFISINLQHTGLFNISIAYSNDGASATEIAGCSIKSCFINILIIYKSEILKQHKYKDGTFYEIYKIKRNTDLSLDKYVKAIMSTGSAELWDVVTSPIEGFVSDDEYIIFKSTYNKKEESKKIEIQLTKELNKYYNDR